MIDFEFREAEDSDVPAILKTLRLALGETPLLRRTPELWHWKHRDNPFGKSIVLVAVSREGTIAGVRALMKWKLETRDNGLIEAVRPVDTATHPDFVRRGIFRRLTMSAIEIARGIGVQLIFNTPNQKSAPGYLDMGWQRVGGVGVQVCPRLGRTIEVQLGERPQIAKWIPEAHEISRLPPGADGPRARMRTTQDLDYLEWRYQKHPFASYGWVPGTRGGGVVVRASERKGRAELVASDLLGLPDPTAIRTASRLSNARYIAGWFSGGTPRRRASVAGGLVPVPGIRTLQLVAHALTDLPVDPFALASWDLSTSDLELL